MIDKARKAGGLDLIRSLVAALEYELCVHAQDGVTENAFGPEDLEASVSEGHVLKIEADELKNSVGNKKYTIVGNAVCGRALYSVGKIVRYDEGLTYRFISIKCDEVNYD
jgi:hypothetical protein